MMTLLKKIKDRLFRLEGLSPLDTLIADVFVGLVEMQKEPETRARVAALLAITEYDILIEMKEAAFIFGLVIQEHLKKKR